MSRNSNVRRTAEQWSALITEQAESDLSQSAFCKRKRLALSTFSLWKRRLSDTSEPAVPQIWSMCCGVLASIQPKAPPS